VTGFKGKMMEQATPGMIPSANPKEMLLGL